MWPVRRPSAGGEAPTPPGSGSPWRPRGSMASVTKRRGAHYSVVSSDEEDDEKEEEEDDEKEEEEDDEDGGDDAADGEGDGVGGSGGGRFGGLGRRGSGASSLDSFRTAEGEPMMGMGSARGGSCSPGCSCARRYRQRKSSKRFQ